MVVNQDQAIDCIGHGMRMRVPHDKSLPVEIVHTSMTAAEATLDGIRTFKAGEAVHTVAPEVERQLIMFPKLYQELRKMEADDEFGTINRGRLGVIRSGFKAAGLPEGPWDYYCMVM